MDSELVIRGLPRSLEMDAWWLDGEGASPQEPRGAPEPSALRRGAPVVWLLLWLVALSDVLLWGHAPGLSLALFSIAVFAVSAAFAPARAIWRPAVLVVLGALPVVEYLQLLSVLFLLASLLLGMAWLHIPGQMPGLRHLRRAGVMFAAIPLQGPSDAFGALMRAASLPQEALGFGRLKAWARIWAFPLGGALILGALITGANPVIEEAVARALDLRVDWARLTLRGLFWLGIALVLWPLVTRADSLPIPEADLPRLPKLRSGLNAGSVLRALVVFNLLLGVQTVFDATLLWGGAALPEGMTYAEYAHRGAYPLLATALLAGAFALAARPFLGEHRWLTPLVLLWLGQNVALCLSSVLRLELYVEAFGLTYLRLYAMIWVALVAAGLSLTAWQIWRERPNSWLLLRSAALGLAVLYLSCFVNFGHIVAAQNLKGDRVRIDWRYLCTLPDVVDPTVMASPHSRRAGPSQLQGCFNGPAEIEGWRDWGFRRWRALRTMEAQAPKDLGNEDTPRG
ncbi:DUF4153 domain-containing protein [Vannielia litorea]|uniref:DUF4153 domain-containing protein n=1 Tax=Vannielia litorea TaxID=1217970 RepID=UPI001BCF2305|nr:DUF4173 domain-containing protein [Vannielia litorea]